MTNNLKYSKIECIFKLTKSNYLGLLLRLIIELNNRILIHYSHLMNTLAGEPDPPIIFKGATISSQFPFS